jgi:hypothetical protein
MISEHHQERRYRLFVTMLVILAAAMMVFPLIPRSLGSTSVIPDMDKRAFSAPVIPFAPMPSTEPVTGVLVEPNSPGDTF